ncbi:hypothetical protein [Listeria costaricensis]|uniref:hypothetical protein n=1 Tax=Listeria costaricensis TaxID=2026604 RepID=UPI000C08A69E|nr:hypothetical protein [Listeria costaricensis]
MDIWTILGIEPTKEKRQIKKAYAEKLKQVRDEDPDEFQRLRQAFDEALAIVEGVENSANSFDFANELFVKNELLSEQWLDGQIDLTIFDGQNETLAFQRWRKMLLETEENYWLLLDPIFWENLTGISYEFDFKEFQQSQRLICLFLADNFQVIDKRTIRALFKHYQLENVIANKEDLLLYNFILQEETIYHVPNFEFIRHEELDAHEARAFFKERYEFYSQLFYPDESVFPFEKVAKTVVRKNFVDADFYYLIVFYHLLNVERIDAEEFRSYLEKANAAAPDNQMQDFLALYMRTESVKKVQLTDDEVRRIKQIIPTFLPNKLYFLYAGYLFFRAKKYAEALEMWNQVSKFHFHFITKPYVRCVKKMKRQGNIKLHDEYPRISQLPQEKKVLFVPGAKPARKKRRIIRWLVFCAVFVLLIYMVNLMLEQQKLEEYQQEAADAQQIIENKLRYGAQTVEDTVENFIDNFVNDPSGREGFINMNVAEGYQEQFSTFPTVELKEMDSLFSDVYVEYMNKSWMAFIIEEDQEYILELDSNYMIEHVWGKGMEEMDDAEFDRLSSEIIRNSIDLSYN